MGYQFWEVLAHEADQSGDVADGIEPAQDDEGVEAVIVLVDLLGKLDDVTKLHIDRLVDPRELLDEILDPGAVLLLWRN